MEWVMGENWGRKGGLDANLGSYWNVSVLYCLHNKSPQNAMA